MTMFRVFLLFVLLFIPLATSAAPSIDAEVLDDGSITLSWSGFSSSVSVERKTGSGNFTSIASGQSSSGSYTDPQPDTGIVHQYRVRSGNTYSPTLTVGINSQTTTTVQTIEETTRRSSLETTAETDSSFESGVFSRRGFTGSFAFDPILRIIKAVIDRPETKAIVITLPLLQIASFYLHLGSLQNLFALIPALLGLGATIVRGTNRQWGLVYDAQTGKPFSGLRMTIVSTGGRRNTIITNGHGMYGLLVPPGSYTVEIDSALYSFAPDNSSAGRFARKTYNNEPIVFIKPGLFAVDIPLAQNTNTTVNPLWLSLKTTEHATQKVLRYIFPIGFVTSLLIAIFIPSVWAFVLLVMYGIIALTKVFGFGAAKWGTVRSRKNKKPVTFATVKLLDTFTKNMLSRSVSDELGRYYINEKRGKYTLVAQHTNRATGAATSNEKSTLIKKRFGVVTDSIYI